MLFDLKNDMEEIWKTVKGYNGYYQVSNTGKVRNPNKVLTPNVGVKNGYVYVTLRKDKRLLHRIVAETFIPNPFNKPEVDHINGTDTLYISNTVPQPGQTVKIVASTPEYGTASAEDKYIE